jgi:CPA2 family monovalent cation:H+ antiporter-2
MEELEFLKPLFIVFGTSALVVFILHRFRIPSIVGFLMAGIIMGPYGFELVSDVHVVEVLAEIGVILLLFTIGMEFSLGNLYTLRYTVFGGGHIQVLLTTGIIALISYFFFQQTMNAALFDGFLVSLSSTAIVIKLLFDRGEIATPYGNTSVGILIFQDLCVVPLMLLVPVLAGKGGSAGDIFLIMLKATVVVVMVIFIARWGVPLILHQVVHTKSRELFVITIMLICVGTALLTFELGLSLALGAFLAGIVISESEYASQAISDVLPFKESFIGLFFISIGMLMNLDFFRQHLFFIIGIVAMIFLVKVFTAGVAAYIVKQSLKNSFQTGFYLSQIGEFSFILAVAGKMHGLITEDLYQLFISATILTMLITPFTVGASSSVSTWLVSRRFLRRFDSSQRGVEHEKYPAKKSDHVIIVGFGVNGSNLARVLKASEIPYVILELNSNAVRAMKKKGEPIYYGDGTSTEILHKLKIQYARILVIAISDAAATRKIVQVARRENPSLNIIVRTRYVLEVEDLKKMGANEVIPEEFETSVEIFSRVLHHYNMPRNVVNEYIENIRSDSYKMLRSLRIPRKYLAEREEFLKGLGNETYLITKDSWVDDHSLADLNLRAKTGATIIAIQRKDKIHHNPSPDFVLKSGDIVLLVGERENIDRAIEYIESKEPSKG